MVTKQTKWRRFRPAVVKDLIHKILMEQLSDKRFASDQAKLWTTQISDNIRAQLKGLIPVHWTVRNMQTILPPCRALTGEVQVCCSGGDRGTEGRGSQVSLALAILYDS